MKKNLILSIVIAVILTAGCVHQPSLQESRKAFPVILRSQPDSLISEAELSGPEGVLADKSEVLKIVPSGSTYVVNCNILDQNFDLIKKLPGRLCIFFPEGSFVSADDNKLTFFDQNLKIKWTKNMSIHHQLNLNSKGELLMLGSEIKIFKGKKVRFDKLLIISKNGEILKEWSFYDHANELNALDGRKKIKLIKTNWFKHIFPDTEYEFAHANSFYEIPENEASSNMPAMNAGNYIITSKFKGFFIIDKDLKKILWYKKYLVHGRPVLHDVQVLSNGNFFIYNNDFDAKKRISTLDEFSPSLDKAVWQYGLKEGEQFYSGFGGGCQKLKNDNILFSDIGIGADETFKEAFIKVIDRKGNLLLKKKYQIFGKNELFLQIKEHPLELFLKKNQAP